MDKLNIFLQIIINLNLLWVLILTIYRRFIFKKKAEAIREFANFADKNNIFIKQYDMHLQAKLNALDKIILSGLSYEDKK